MATPQEAELAGLSRTVRPGSAHSLTGRTDSARLTAQMLLTAEQLAARWQVPKTQVYRLAREGKLPVVTLGRYRRFRVDHIEAWEESQTGALDFRPDAA